MLLTVESAAERLALGRTTVYQLIGAGELRALKIGRSTRVAASEVDRYIARLRAEQTPELELAGAPR